MEAAQQQQKEEKKVEPQTLEEKLLEARKAFYENETPKILDGYKLVYATLIRVHSS